jgi:hypothetical protein
MFQAIQIKTRAQQRGLSHHQKEIIELIIPDSIFDKHTKTMSLLAL